MLKGRKESCMGDPALLQAKLSILFFSQYPFRLEEGSPPEGGGHSLELPEIKGELDPTVRHRV